MTTYFVAQWSVPADRLAEHDAALKRLLAHTRGHAAIRSFQVLRQRWGPLPRHGYLWVEEYDSLDALDRDSRPPACTCVEQWAPIHALAVEGTFRAGVWTNPLDDEAAIEAARPSG